MMVTAKIKSTVYILFVSIIILCSGENIYASTEDSLSTNNSQYNKYRLGGYGEILYQHMDYGLDRYSDPSGSPSLNRATVSMPRIVFSFDYKFNKSIYFSTEIEFEHGGTGSALELEYEEAGEYEMEMEKAGEVVLEQLQFTKVFHPYFRVRVGHMILPIGQTNNKHESILYFGTVRPESESSIIPLTWHETGISILGNYRDWTYQFFLINGLDANGFSSAYWIREGKQGIFEETKMTDPAFAFRIDNKSIYKLRLSVSGYLGNSTGNTAKPEKMDHLKGQVSIISADVEYSGKKLIVRGNAIYGNLTDSYEISAINKTISKNIQYQRTPVAQNALAYGGECGYKFKLPSQGTSIIPFIRYEYYNTMEGTQNGIHADDRFKRDILTAGFNYYILPTIAIKADFSHRRINMGEYNSENTLGLTLVYTGWFIKK